MVWDFRGGTVIRIHLPMQVTRVQSLVWKDSTCRGIAKLMHHNYRALLPHLLSLHTATTEASAPRGHAPQ